MRIVFPFLAVLFLTPFALAAEAVPASAAVVEPSCAVPNVSARLLTSAMPDAGDFVHYSHATVIVRITLLPSGTVGSATIYQPSGIGTVDKIAIDAARSSKYSAPTINCEKVQGQFLYRVEIDGDTSAPPPVPPPAPPLPCGDRPAMMYQLVAPKIPASLRDKDLQHTSTFLQVALDATGKVTDVTILRSSADAELDEAAIASARSSKIFPPEQACKPMAGTLAYRVEFAPHA